MKFTRTPIAGAFMIEPEASTDARGFFARTVCDEQFAQHGLNARFVQQSISRSEGRGILRGMHYQCAPHEEEKLVRVTCGAVWDVLLDLRPDSPSFLRWFGAELSADNHAAFYIPKGVAHGFQTLSERAEVMYQMTVAYAPSCERGVLWNDSAFGISWPLPEPILSARDTAHPLWQSHSFKEKHHDSSL